MNKVYNSSRYIWNYFFVGLGDNDYCLELDAIQCHNDCHLEDLIGELHSRPVDANVSGWGVSFRVYYLALLCVFIDRYEEALHLRVQSSEFAEYSAVKEKTDLVC